MPRKGKEKTLVGSVSRRRTVLQIEPVSRRRETEAMRPSLGMREINPTSISGIGLLGQYADNSDDEELKDDLRDENEPVDTSNIVSEKEPKEGNEVQIDSKLVDFFKEIQAISNQDTKPEESHDVVDNNSGASGTNQEQLAETQATYYSSEASYTVPHPWQEVCDPGTNYIYYWNTLTNEVSWEMPQISSEVPPELSRPEPQEVHQDSTSESPAGPEGPKCPSLPDEETRTVKEETADHPPVQPDIPRSLEDTWEDSSPSEQAEPCALEPSDEEMSRGFSKPDPYIVNDSDAGPSLTKSDRNGSGDSPPPEPGEKPKKRSINTVIDMFESETQETGPETTVTESESVSERYASGKMEGYVAEDMPEYPPTPENLSNSAQNSPDASQVIDDQFVVVDDWQDDGNEDVDVVEADESSKKEVISVDEDANEGPSKKARYDSDSEQGSDGDFAEKLLEEFLEGKTSGVRASGDDMEVDSDVESKESINDKAGPLLPPKAFQHNMTDQTLANQENSHLTEDSSKQSQANVDKSKEEDEKLTTEIFDLCALLTNKLDFLNVTKDGLNKLQLVLLQMETRIKDWREGGLSSQYLVKRLREADLDLKTYEKSAAPNGWSCHWDSSYKRYFYTDDKTGESQWDYPQAAVVEDTSVATSTAVTSLNPATAGLWGASSFVQGTSASYDMLTTPVEHCQVYSSNATVPTTYQTMTPENSSSAVVTQDPYRIDAGTPPLVDDEVKGPVDGSKTPPPPGESPPPPPPPPELTSVPPPPPPQDDATVVITPPPPPPIPPTPVESKSDSVQQTDSIPGFAVQYGPIHFVGAQRLLLDYSDVEPTAGSESPDAQGTLTAQVKSSSNSRPSHVSMGSTAGTKTKKKKTKSSVPMRSSKVKMLVQKWQAIKEQDEVLPEDESDEEDQAAKSVAQIQEWKKEQILSGQAASNPNFVEIKGDWRERVRKAKFRAATTSKVDPQNQ